MLTNQSQVHLIIHLTLIKDLRIFLIFLTKGRDNSLIGQHGIVPSDNSRCNTSLFWDNGFNSLTQARNNDGKMQLYECLGAPAGVNFGVNYRVRFDFIANDGDPRFLELTI